MHTYQHQKDDVIKSHVASGKLHCPVGGEGEWIMHIILHIIMKIVLTLQIP